MTGHEPTQRPSERFSGSAGVIDIHGTAGELLASAEAGPHGRVQRTLYRGGGVTIAMFAFQAGAALPSHSAGAVVSVHVLHGRVSMVAGGDPFELRSGQLLRIEPRVTHEVLALDPSVILVHIAAGSA